MSQNQSAVRTQHTRKARLPAVRRLALAAPVAAGLALAAAVIPAGIASASPALCPGGPCGAYAVGEFTYTTVSSSANPSEPGQPVTYTATTIYYPDYVPNVVPPTPANGKSYGVPGGTVGFTDNGTPIPGCTAVPESGSGTATCQATPAPGTHTIRADYSGYYPSRYHYWGGSWGTMTQVVQAPLCNPLYCSGNA